MTGADPAAALLAGYLWGTARLAVVVRIGADGTILEANRAFLELIAEGENPVSRPLGEFLARAGGRPLAADPRGLEAPLEVFNLPRSRVFGMRIQGCLVPLDGGACLLGERFLADSIEALDVMTATTVELANLSRELQRKFLSRIQGIEAMNQSEHRRTEQERTSLQAQLAQVQKLDSLGSLAGGVAHDINNVLGAILALATVHLVTSGEDSQVNRDMRTVIKACTRGGNLVKGLLAFSRRELGEEADVDLNAVVRDELELLERTTLQKIRLETGLDPGLWAIRGDAPALTHCLMNLCVNAIDAMPGGGTLTVRTRNEGPEQVLLEVEDWGTGMGEETLARALEPFFTTKPQGQGTGLGLAIVYGTVKTHGGHLDIVSEPGRGTRVALRFPALGRRPADAARQTRSELPSPRRALAVLLVDDDELIRHSVKALVELLGHTVAAAASGEEALDWVAAGGRADLVILDMNMPGLDGQQTLVALRLRQPTLPVLLATGRIDQTALDLVASYKQVAILPKPFDLDALQGQLDLLFVP